MKTMNLKWKTEKYFSKKENKEVTNEVLVIQKKDETEVGLGIRDVLVGKFKFSPNVRDVVAKQGKNAGKSFKVGDGLMSFENLDAKYESKLNKFGNVKVDFSKCVKDFEFNKIGEKWQDSDIAFFMRPYINTTTNKTAWSVSMAPITPLTKEQVEAALFLRQDESAFSDTDLSVELEETKQVVKVQRWALLISEERLKGLVK